MLGKPSRTSVRRVAIGSNVGNCLLPLCPTCIKIHTAEHVSMRTTPQYEQINHLLNQVSGDIQKCSRVLEGDLDRLVGIKCNAE